jgi:predicted MFS family arabinose efflux permease
MHFGFSVISFGLFLLTWPAVVQDYSRTILYSIYFLVFSWGLVRALGPTIFHYYPYSFLKNIPNAATWSSSVWQIANVMGPAFAGFSITLIGVHWSMCTVFVCSIFALLALSQIDKKPIMNQNRRAGDAEFNRRNKICLQQ